MSSTEPVSSPTAIICRINGVNISLCLAVLSRVSPLSIPPRIPLMWVEIQALSVVSATTVNAVVTGMPADSMVAKFLANRLSVINSSNGPIIGNLSL